MILVNFLSFIVFLISFPGIFCQSEIFSVNYTAYYSNYNAYLILNNPNGLNNFKTISGTHVSGKTDDDVMYIYRAGNSISTNFPSIICEKFKNSQQINVQSLGMERIDEYSFKNCKNLTYIYLYGNKISVINEKSFTENLKLKYLYLIYNKLTNLPENLFANQQMLETLNLENNQISALPNNIFRPLIKLSTLSLGTNKITKLQPEWFETLGMLKYLYLASNLIEELPKNIFDRLENVTSINLRYNKLKIIYADSFGHLLSSPSIDLYSNKIYAIDEDFIYNTGPSSLNLQLNICGEKTIYDTTVYRVLMRAGFKDCFEQYDFFIGRPSTTTATVLSTPQSTTPRGISITPSSSGISENRISLLEEKVKNLTISNVEMTSNWKNQYISSSNNQDSIKRLQNTVYWLQKNSDSKDVLIDELKTESLRLKNVTTEMQGKIDAILKDNAAMKKNFQSEIVSLTTELQNLQSQIKVLNSCVTCSRAI